MKRKLVRQGVSTMMVSLPSKWIKANNLDKGDEIDLEENGNTLILGQSSSKKKEKYLQINSLSEWTVRTIIASAYREGYDTLFVKYDNKKTLEIIETTIKNNLIGFEIIKKSDRECTVQNITEPSPEQLENIFSKVFLNIEELFDLTLSAMNKDYKPFAEVEQAIIRFDNFCRRIVAKQKPEKFHIRWAFQTALNHGQRELYHLLEYLNKLKVKVPNEASELLSLTKEAFLLIKRSYLEKNIKYLEEIHVLEKEIVFKKGYAALKKDIDDITIYHILSAMRNFYLAVSPLTALLLESGE